MMTGFRWIGFALTAAALCACAGNDQATARAEQAADDRKPSRPDIIFIAIDDLNDWVEGWPGAHEDAKTPNIARLARRGVSFTNAHAAASVCNPSRIALLTGKSPRRTGVYANTQQPMRDFLPDALTIFEHFDNHGYYVAGTGKLFHNPDNVDQRWDEYFNARGHPRPDRVPWHGLDQLTEEITRSFDWGPVDAPPARWAEYKMASFAIEKLSEPRDEPLFLAVGFRLPHLRWHMPRESWDAIAEEPALPPFLGDDKADMPPAAAQRSARAHEIIDGGRKWREAIRGYLASTHFVDVQVGRILDALDQSGRADNAVIVLWSDHGWHLGEKQAWRKFSFWEEATRVPLIFAGPGVEQDVAHTSPVSLLDIYPTLSAMAGLPAPDGLDGEDLSATLRDGAPPAPAREGVITSLQNGDTIRTARWRYTRYGNGDEELYDHRNDPNEWTNLAAAPAHKDTLARLRALMPESGRAPLRAAVSAPDEGATSGDD